MVRRYKDKNGFTLIEMVAVLAIVSVLTVTAMAAFANSSKRTKVQKSIMEAETVFRGIQMYLILEYQEKPLECWEIAEELNNYPLTSKKNIFYPYLGSVCSKRAQVIGITINEKDRLLIEMEYEVDGYRITTSRNKTTEVKEIAGRSPR